ncbi:MAG TPA: hypothetical protein VMM83_04630, partial [Longimicrobiales bacterium]|nr:hypothetical protein [Longimicrobiales bacterium]
SREFSRARRVLVPAADRPGAPAEEVAEAEALLGSLALWRGDLAEAASRFERALALQPGHAEAARQLREIHEWSRPWVEAQLHLTDDNQPYTRVGGTFLGGVFLNPLWSASVRIAPGTLEAGESVTTVDAAAGVRGYLPAARLEVDAGAGAIRDSRGGSDPIGFLSLARRMSGESALRLSVARERYTGTAASVDTLLLYRRIELRFDRAAAPGWAGEVVARAERFPDGNVIRTAYAWALAPVLPFLRAGYAAAWQDADFSTWQQGPAAPGPGVPHTAGPARYDPYYTPHSAQVHTALAELLARLGSASLRFSGAVGVLARELAPELVTGPAPGQTELQFAERSFTPWRLTATLDLPVNPSWRLRVVGEREATAFYEVLRVTAGGTYRLGGGRWK